jgi:hypothetical protein
VKVIRRAAVDRLITTHAAQASYLLDLRTRGPAVLGRNPSDPKPYTHVSQTVVSFQCMVLCGTYLLCLWHGVPAGQRIKRNGTSVELSSANHNSRALVFWLQDLIVSAGCFTLAQGENETKG